MRRTSRLFAGIWDDRRLCFLYRCVQFMPHPHKQATGGEDAFLSLQGAQAVFDGVSWWKENTTVDAGLYSAALARAMHDHIEDDRLGDIPSSQELLQHAYDSCDREQIEGTSTALVATLQPRRDDEAKSPYVNSVLDVISVGDCTAVLVRGGLTVFKSGEQTHGLDFPYQLGKGSSDTPDRALNYRCPVERGDLLLLGSDGVFDNLYIDHAVELMWSHVQNVFTRYFNPCFRYKAQPGQRFDLYEDIMRAIAIGSEKVMCEARMAAVDIYSDTPYAHKAIEGGAHYVGGKLDDMTFIVSVIDEDTDVDSGERFVRAATMNPVPYRDWP